MVDKFVPIGKQRETEMLREMGEAVTKMNDESAVLPEAVFVQHILPLLAGTADGKRVDLGLWTSIAGTTFRGIDVVDNHGTLLFRCPPIQRQLTTEIRGKDSRTYRNTTGEIIANANNIAKNSPRKARQFMDEALSKKVPRVPIDMQRALAFDTILKRYGYPGLGLPQDRLPAPDPKTVAIAKPTVTDYDDFEF